MTDLVSGALSLIGSLLFYVVCFVAPVAGIAAVLHLALSIPLRRRERGRLFIDLLDTALAQGRPVEQTLVDIANSHDRTPGVRFHLLAAHLASGLRLSEALARVPRLLPPQVTAMLRVGEKLGDLRRVLPACREWFQERPTGTQSAYHYMIVLLLVFSPIAVCILTFLMIRVVPKFMTLLTEMGAQPPVVTLLLIGFAKWLLLLQAVVAFTLLISAFLYIGGPRATGWLRFGRAPFVDWLAWQVPWKRKRMQRTFSATLAVLLDGGVPEGEAVGLAGDCTANAIARRRAARVAEALQQGIKLQDAVAAFDGHGEFRWRLTNACHAHGGFRQALAAWHDSLDAKAFQEEEAAAHVITSGLVVLNGAFVAMTAVGVFGALIAIMEMAGT
jgi:type IV pilus assembly protein PilC